MATNALWVVHICLYVHLSVLAWVFNMVVRCLSVPIPHLPSTQISWHVAKANRHEDGAEGIAMQPSMQFVLTLSGVLSSPLILMSSPGFRFTGIQHPNEVPGLGGGGGLRTTSIQLHKHALASTRKTSHWHTDTFSWAERHRIEPQVMFLIVFLFQTQPPIWVGSNYAKWGLGMSKVTIKSLFPNVKTDVFPAWPWLEGPPRGCLFQGNIQR